MNQFINPYLNTPVLNQPMMNQQIQRPQVQMNNGINWVQGVEGANAIQLPPNSNMVLIDSTRDYMYIKSTDNIGMPSIRVFKFAEENINASEDKYVTRDEFQQFINSIKGGNDNVPLSADVSEPVIKQSTDKTTNKADVRNISR